VGAAVAADNDISGALRDLGSIAGERNLTLTAEMPAGEANQL
jgi:hypothetical protein